MSFEYFYGGQSDSFSFYRIPRQLVTGAEFRNLSTDAKLLYGMMLDRMGLSARNGWYDDFDRVYIYYTIDEIMEDLCCGHNKAVRLLAELDTNGVGLIERKKQGQGKPTMIYVKQFVETAPNAPREKYASPRLPKTGSAEDSKEEVQPSQNETSRLPEKGNAEFPKRETNYTDTSKTENSYTDPSIHPSYCPKVERAVIEADVREQIDYPCRLAESYPYDDPESILELICDVLCSNADTIRIANENIPTPKVQERYRRLDFEHVTYVLDSLRETTTKIKNIRGYLLTALYYAPITIGPYYAAAVRHDFG